MAKKNQQTGKKGSTQKFIGSQPKKKLAKKNLFGRKRRPFTQKKTKVPRKTKLIHHSNFERKRKRKGAKRSAEKPKIKSLRSQTNKREEGLENCQAIRDGFNIQAYWELINDAQVDDKDSTIREIKQVKGLLSKRKMGKCLLTIEQNNLIDKYNYQSGQQQRDYFSGQIEGRIKTLIKFYKQNYHLPNEHIFPQTTTPILLTNAALKSVLKTYYEKMKQKTCSDSELKEDSDVLHICQNLEVLAKCGIPVYSFIKQESLRQHIFFFFISHFKNQSLLESNESNESNTINESAQQKQNKRKYTMQASYLWEYLPYLCAFETNQLYQRDLNKVISMFKKLIQNKKSPILDKYIKFVRKYGQNNRIKGDIVQQALFRLASKDIIKLICFPKQEQGVTFDQTILINTMVLDQSSMQFGEVFENKKKWENIKKVYFLLVLIHEAAHYVIRDLDLCDAFDSSFKGEDQKLKYEKIQKAKNFCHSFDYFKIDELQKYPESGTHIQHQLFQKRIKMAFSKDWDNYLAIQALINDDNQSTTLTTDVDDILHKIGKKEKKKDQTHIACKRKRKGNQMQKNCLPIRRSYRSCTGFNKYGNGMFDSE